jgi:hypothetical protein
MERGYRRSRWAVFLAVAIVATLVGVFAYNAGVTQGIAQAGQAAGAPGTLVPYAYGWHRPWGFGFFFPFLFFGLWFLALRGLFWGGHWRRHRYYAGYHDLPPAFDEWHRRAHERMTKEPAGSPNDDDRSRR